MSRDPYPNLQRAMQDFGIPFDNRALIERMCSQIGIASLLPYRDHIRAIREDSSKPALHIHVGWTEGFLDKEEACQASDGRAPIVKSDHLRSGNFYVEHPINRLA